MCKKKPSSIKRFVPKTRFKTETSATSLVQYGREAMSGRTEKSQLLTFLAITFFREQN